MEYVRLTDGVACANSIPASLDAVFKFVATDDGTYLYRFGCTSLYLTGCGCETNPDCLASVTEPSALTIELQQDKQYF